MGQSMTSQPTHMRREVEEIPDATRRLLAGSADRFAEAGAALRRLDPVMIATIARGSSDHATAFLKYAIEISAGIPVASIGPSITSIYGRELRLKGCAAISISQSGGSPDIVAMTRSARQTGALTLALTNTPDSPLGREADVTIDLLAGRELSVAATKSFISSVVAGLAILASWTEDASLAASLAELPDVFARSIAVDWSALLSALDGHKSLYVLGRGPAFAVAEETWFTVAVE